MHNLVSVCRGNSNKINKSESKCAFRLIFLSVIRPLQHLCQELTRVTLGDAGNLLGGTFGYYRATRLATLGTHIYDPVGALDDIEVVLDDNHAVATLYELAEDAEELTNILEV